jgi:hypothetical protein
LGYNLVPSLTETNSSSYFNFHWVVTALTIAIAVEK